MDGKRLTRVSGYCAAGQARLGIDLPGQVIRVDASAFDKVDYGGLLAAARRFLEA